MAHIHGSQMCLFDLLCMFRHSRPLTFVCAQWECSLLIVLSDKLWIHVNNVLQNSRKLCSRDFKIKAPFYRLTKVNRSSKEERRQADHLVCSPKTGSGWRTYISWPSASRASWLPSWEWRHIRLAQVYQLIAATWRVGGFLQCSTSCANSNEQRFLY